MINNVITYSSAAYIRDLTVVPDSAVHFIVQHKFHKHNATGVITSPATPVRLVCQEHGLRRLARRQGVQDKSSRGLSTMFFVL